MYVWIYFDLQHRYVFYNNCCCFRWFIITVKEFVLNSSEYIVITVVKAIFIKNIIFIFSEAFYKLDAFSCNKEIC